MRLLFMSLSVLLFAFFIPFLLIKIASKFSDVCSYMTFSTDYISLFFTYQSLYYIFYF